MESNALIKVVRYGFNLAYAPSEHTVEQYDRQIDRQKQTYTRNAEDLVPERPLLAKKKLAIEEDFLQAIALCLW
jgi:hypothetical protein